MDVCICVTEFPCCLPETSTALLIGYTPIQNKKFPKKKKKSNNRKNPSELSEHWYCFLSKNSCQDTSLFISVACTVHSHFVDCGSLIAIKAK